MKRICFTAFIAIFAAIFATVFATIFAAATEFAGPSAEKSTARESSGLRKVRVASTQAYPPYDFINDAGEPAGFEVDVLKAIDELLPDYEFEFTGTTDDDLLIGVESGKYAVGVKGAWVTEERKKKYIIPKCYIAASIIGIAVRTADNGSIKDFDSFARFSGKLVPIPPQSAQYSVVEEYNRAHPTSEVKLIPSDTFIISDAYTWVVEGRYDAFFDIKLSFQNQVLNGNGAWHVYADKLTYIPYKAIPTYPLFNKRYQDLADKYDAAIEKLTAEGVITGISEKYFGEDIFKYIE
ncbi:MAG: transporter substrate-binding domain-containing protein [Spirochaetaceae bacterium]|jgi:L-cystine transport system substrate-binding protein|nr:transporter substrate-binding domain-containing protein [Spirochaetaceae bacterium]